MVLVFLSFSNSLIRRQQNLHKAPKFSKMNFACLICWESYSESCIIATAPCGHVFHFDCIQKWLRTGNQDCAQCRQKCETGQITKLYFSEDKSALDENHVRIGLEEENLKWKMEANAANETSIQFQKENIKLKKKLYDIKTQSSKAEENLNKRIQDRVSVQGVKSLGGHFECLCREFEIYEVKKKLLFFKKKREILLHF